MSFSLLSLIKFKLWNALLLSTVWTTFNFLFLEEFLLQLFWNILLVMEFVPYFAFRFMCGKKSLNPLASEGHGRAWTLEWLIMSYATFPPNDLSWLTTACFFPNDANYNPISLSSKQFSLRWTASLPHKLWKALEITNLNRYLSCSAGSPGKETGIMQFPCCFSN